MKKIGLEQGTPEWIAYRLNGVGGSDIASIIGSEGAFKNRQEVLMEKLGHTKELSEFQKKLFQDGHEWEALVRDQLNTQGFNFRPEVVECQFNNRLFASLDGLDVDREMILEVKSVMSMDKFKAYVANPPAHYITQCQWQMMVTGLPVTLLAFVCQGEVAVKEVHADPHAQAKLIVEADQFLDDLDKVKAGTMPAPVQQVSTLDMERLFELKSASVEASKALEALDQQIKELAEKILADHQAIHVQSPFVTVQWCEREGSVDYKKIPELSKIDLNQYRKKATKFLKVSLNKQ
jgi:putative phage-type endonuclease